MADASQGVRARKTAARALAAVAAGQSLPEALAASDSGALPPRDRAFVRRLCTGVLRHKRRLSGELGRLLSKPIGKPLVENLLLVGLHELDSGGSPHAAVHSAVEAAPVPLRKLVNAILRRYQREGAGWKASSPAQTHSYPDWMATALQADWPEVFPAILANGNEDLPMVVRVNQRNETAANYASRLGEAGITCRPGGAAALILDEVQPLARLPGFADGDVSIQGIAAQQTVALLDIQPGDRVLDACAAPGGKSAQILEQFEPAGLLSLDHSAERLDLLRATIGRLGLAQRSSHAIQAGDALQPHSWWDDIPFQRILLDVPCSGTGVIRRHPDIKWLRRETDIAEMQQRQRAMLDALWPLLAPGGKLLYASCSILTAENDDVVGAFLAEHSDDAKAQKLALPEGERSRYGWRVPPGGAWEGFYYCLIGKCA